MTNLLNQIDLSTLDADEIEAITFDMANCGYKLRKRNAQARRNGLQVRSKHVKRRRKRCKIAQNYAI